MRSKQQGSQERTWGRASDAYIEERVLQVAGYIVENGATVRDAAKVFKVSKSTVHKDVSERLCGINPTLAREVRQCWISIKRNGISAGSGDLPQIPRAWARPRRINRAPGDCACVSGAAQAHARYACRTPRF
jgi:sporulation transcriptional regulator SpoIIID